MLHLKKEAQPLKEEEFRLRTCPVCSGYVCHVYFMRDAVTKKESKWFSCSCGVVFNEKAPQMVYDKKYWDRNNEFCNKVRPAYEYVVRIYAPVIEELLYGRKVLLIGKQNPYQEDAFRERGWVSYSIDKNIDLEVKDRIIQGDFETYDFHPDLKFGMIWMYHTFECLNDPLKSLLKMKSMLDEDGILFIASPDTDFIHTRGSASFRHWKPDMHNMMWNKRALTRQLENLGFNIIMSRNNCWDRFPETDDFHIIAQRKFF